ncbi:MAG: hypothetical protein K2G14_04715, partial [Ruminococcus sp.]|nr:hypothetical protein [Ruminococcus sp.]
MAKKKVLNVGKIMVLSGAVIILVMVAFLCGHFLKATHEGRPTSNIPVPQNATPVNTSVPPVTTTITSEMPAVIPQTTAAEIPTETTTTTTLSGIVTGPLTIKDNGEFQDYVIKLANPALNIYSEPSYNSMILDVITDRGSYTITKEVLDDEGNKWGLLETDFGWINLVDARKADPQDDIHI